MRHRLLVLTGVLSIACAPIAMAQNATTNLFQPTAAPQTTPAASQQARPAANQAAAAPVATTTNTSNVIAPAPGGSQEIPSDARVKTITMRNYETCTHVVNKVQGKMPGAQSRETAAGLVITRRDNVATYVNTCAKDGTLTSAIYTGNRVPANIANPGVGGGSRAIVAPVANQQQR